MADEGGRDDEEMGGFRPVHCVGVGVAWACAWLGRCVIRVVVARAMQVAAIEERWYGIIDIIFYFICLSTVG